MADLILVTFIADGLVALAFSGIGILTVMAVVLVERRRLLRFFGVTHSSPDVRIYLSRIQILERPGGVAATQGFEPIVTGYFGPAISKLEYDSALLIGSMFRSRLMALLPTSFRQWLGQRFATIMPIEPVVDVSPQSVSELPSGNLFVIGSSIYNLLTKHYLDRADSNFRFTKAEDTRAITFAKGGLMNTVIPGRPEREVAIIERFNEADRSVFIFAGLGTASTFGAVRYLTENWRALQRSFGNEEFALWLGFSGQSPEGPLVAPPDIVSPTEPHLSLTGMH